MAWRWRRIDGNVYGAVALVCGGSGGAAAGGCRGVTAWRANHNNVTRIAAERDIVNRSERDQAKRKRRRSGNGIEA